MNDAPKTAFLKGRKRAELVKVASEAHIAKLTGKITRDQIVVVAFVL